MKSDMSSVTLLGVRLFVFAIARSVATPCEETDCVSKFVVVSTRGARVGL